MPTYEYLCESCGHRFEAFQHISDAPLATCPNCSGHIHRVLFPAGIVFKGAGFYKTDSRGTSSAATPAPVSHEASNGASPNGKHAEAAASADAKTESPSSTKSDKSSASDTATGS